MRVFITGATGFIGRYVMKELHEAGYDILALTLEKDKIENSYKDVQWLYGDLEDLKCLKPAIRSFNADVVIHLAWQGIPDFSEAMSWTNLYNSTQLLHFIIEETNCKKIIVSGSCFEYGKKQGVCKESDQVNIDSYFTWAKHALNLYLSIKCAQKRITLNWLRIFYVYGPGQREGSLIPTLIKSIGESRTPTINTPLNKNDFVFIGDVAKVFVRAVDLDLSSGIYNLGSGNSSSIYDVCRIVEKQLIGTETISNHVLKSGQQRESVNFWADMNKTKEALNMLCDTPLRDGIKAHIHSMQSVVSN